MLANSSTTGLLLLAVESGGIVSRPFHFDSNSGPAGRDGARSRRQRNNTVWAWSTHPPLWRVRCCLLLISGLWTAGPVNWIAINWKLDTRFSFFLIVFLVCVKMLHWEYHKEECEQLEEQIRQESFISYFPFIFSDTLARLSVLGYYFPFWAEKHNYYWTVYHSTFREFIHW